MGLLANGYRHNLTGKLFGATALDGANPSVQEARGHLTARNRNQFAGEGITSKLASVPSGTRHPVAWIMAPQNGAISARVNDIVITATGSAAMGKAAEGTAPITITLTGEGGLISSATGEALVTVSLGGELFASKAAAGEATLTISADGTATAIGHLGGDATATVTATWTPYGIGWLGGTTEESGLTPSGVANAVWAKVIEAGFSADQILRLLAAHAAGSATGLEGANPQFTGLDGTTLRIDGAYNAGTRTIDALNGD